MNGVKESNTNEGFEEFVYSKTPGYDEVTVSVAIDNLREALEHDVKLLRSSPGIPKEVNIYGYLFNIDTGEFTSVISDPARSQ